MRQGHSEDTVGKVEKMVSGGSSFQSGLHALAWCEPQACRQLPSRPPEAPSQDNCLWADRQNPGCWGVSGLVAVVASPRCGHRRCLSGTYAEFSTTDLTQGMFMSSWAVRTAQWGGGSQDFLRQGWGKERGMRFLCLLGLDHPVHTPPHPPPHQRTGQGGAA